MSTGDAQPQRCPSCRGVVYDTPGYPTWCPACEWNVDGGHTPEQPTGWFHRRYRAMSERAARQLLDSVTRPDGLRPHRSAGRMAVIAIATVVHLCWVALIVAGILCLVLAPAWPVVVLGLVALAAAVVGRPRFGRLPKDEPLLRREDAPTLFAMLDRVAEQAHTRAADVVTLTDDYNMAVTQVGLRGTRLLIVGLPLWYAAPPEHRLAILGHEFGHFAGGDPMRGRFVGTALEALRALSSPPTTSALEVDGLSSLTVVAERIVRGALALLFRPPLWALYLLSRRDQQRAEYIADAIGAAVAGSSAEIGSDATVRNLPTVQVALHRTTAQLVQQSRGGRLPSDLGLWRAIAKAIEAIPPHEAERRRRAGLKDEVDLQHTHPPTWMRTEAISRRPTLAPAMHVGSLEWQRIEAELAPTAARVERELVDAARWS